MTCNFRFPGKIYAPQDPSENAYPEFFLIYDKNNAIVGMHSVVPEVEKISEYSMPSKWYREFPNIQNIPKYRGKQIFVATAYFVDPELICKDGGSQKGLGDRLLFQSGASIKDVLIAPLEQTGADSDVSFTSLLLTPFEITEGLCLMRLFGLGKGCISQKLH